MAMKNSSVHFFSLILWLSLLILFFGWWNIFSKDINGIHHQISISHLSFSNRKVLLATKFDFTPFLHHHKHHRRHRPRHVPIQPEPSGDEIDPRHGVEKRLVPTGPNPLHH
ncbi:CLAVATA3/ESR (CLE)-related protein 13-like [Durio zibethinus]|uniref:CLAVATA3/ESR (CLE)-related protein 13-like n=1 Tax=Durio zibethinus TaxID=66656 RepID=A0A6P5YAB1_DURZI|nr:CLAVATA3/ESR (CLE)-related protein 13-like [Durio zibethinus]